MLILTSIVRYGKSKFVTGAIDEDSYDRILQCIRVLSSNNPRPELTESFMGAPRKAFSSLVSATDVTLLSNKETRIEES
jgi:coatomer subunit beta